MLRADSIGYSVYTRGSELPEQAAGPNLPHIGPLANLEEGQESRPSKLPKQLFVASGLVCTDNNTAGGWWQSCNSSATAPAGPTQPDALGAELMQIRRLKRRRLSQCGRGSKQQGLGSAARETKHAF